MKYSEIKSGMCLDREQLQRLLRDLVDQKFAGGYVVATSFDRVVRLGRQIVELIVSIGNAELVYIAPDESESDSSHSEMVSDLLAVVAYWNGQLYGKRSRDLLRVEVDSNITEQILKWTKAGMSYRWQANKLREMNVKDVKDKVFISRAVVRRIAVENLSALEFLTETIEQGSFAHFFKEHCKITNIESNTISHKQLMKRYRVWCQANNPVWSETSNTKVCKALTELGCKGTYTKSKLRLWCGVSFSSKGEM